LLPFLSPRHFLDSQELRSAINTPNASENIDVMNADILPKKQTIVQISLRRFFAEVFIRAGLFSNRFVNMAVRSLNTFPLKVFITE
jgi:hypothetical protein